MYDLIVIGGGPGGYVAAIRAAQQGAKVVLIEKEQLGGICLNWGCIPTKSLLESASVYKKILKASEYGVDLDEVTVKPNLSRMVERSRQIVTKLNAGVTHLMTKNGITVIYGTAKLVSSKPEQKIVSVDSNEIVGKNVIIATGAKNRQPKGISIDGDRILDCRHAMTLTKLPASMIVIGGGAIGMEFASFFNTLGTKVTVIEYANTILPFADQDIIKWITHRFKKDGIEFKLNTEVKSVKNNGKEVLIELNSSSLTSDVCLIATGVTPNTNNIGLENVPNIKLDRGMIVTKNTSTNEPGIYAIGDVTHGPWLAHKASYEGIMCTEYIFGKNEKPMHLVPMCVYSIPQIAQIGMTEKEAIQTGKKISVGKFSLASNGKALTEGNDGISKVIFEKNTGIFMGAHLAGEHVTELISTYGVFSQLEGLITDINNTIFPHPTLAEAIQEAALNAAGIGLH